MTFHSDSGKRPKMRCARWLLAFSMVLQSPVPLHAATALPSLGAVESSELSPQMERRLGEQIMRQIRGDRDYLDDAPLREYVNTFGNSLVSARPDVRGEANYDFEFFVVRDKAINAFALPGGFIGLHSALLLSAQSESQLASVMAHEIGHVSQRHIARMLGAQKQDMLIPLAGAILGALAIGAGGDASAALMAGSQGLAMQRMLNFSRNAEREADRIGLQILDEGGFDTSGMVGFLGRMQSASRGYSDTVPPYLLSHPLTTERIADIQSRIQGQRYKQRVDSVDFYLAKARMRVLQDTSGQGLQEAATFFENQLLDKARMQAVAARYGLAMIAVERGQADKAQALFREMRGAGESALLTVLGIDIQMAMKKPEEALSLADAARKQYPVSRSIAYQYAEALLATQRHDEAVTYLRDQSQLYREDVRLQEFLAKAYAAQGRRALQHLALAQAYALIGSVPTALDQLGIARRAPDASFYDQAIIDAKERELRTKWQEQLEESKRMP